MPSKPVKVVAQKELVDEEEKGFEVIEEDRYIPKK